MKERPILFSPADRPVRAAAARLRISPEDYAAALNAGEKFCGGCRQRHPLARFSRGKSRCKECDSIAKKVHYQENREQHRAKQLRYQRENRDRLYAYNAKWQRERNAALRSELLAAYGSKCNCCGERETIFLDLDHVFNDGAAHRKELGNGTVVILALKAQGWPKDRYQLLCCNCNQGKARNGGICQHQTKDRDHA